MEKIAFTMQKKFAFVKKNHVLLLMNHVNTIFLKKLDNC